MTDRGLADSRDDLLPVYSRVFFIDGRVSDFVCVQCNITDPAKAQHADIFFDLWTRSMRSGHERAKIGNVFIFAPELRTPPTGYSITVRDRHRAAFKVSDRWQQWLLLCDLASSAIAEAAA